LRTPLEAALQPIIEAIVGHHATWHPTPAEGPYQRDRESGLTLRPTWDQVYRIVDAVKTLAVDRQTTAAGQVGIAWWNGLSEADRRLWMREAGDTGRPVDAADE
jgi:hypothetical protein